MMHNAGRISGGGEWIQWLATPSTTKVLNVITEIKGNSLYGHLSAASIEKCWLRPLITGLAVLRAFPSRWALLYRSLAGVKRVFSFLWLRREKKNATICGQTEGIKKAPLWSQMENAFRLAYGCKSLVLRIIIVICEQSSAKHAEAPVQESTFQSQILSVRSTKQRAFQKYNLCHVVILGRNQRIRHAIHRLPNNAVLWRSRSFFGPVWWLQQPS